jgi:hypothetical protein
MVLLKFSDGVYFDAAGPLRIESRRDGLYVVGDGMVIPIDNRLVGQELIAIMEAEKTKE